MNVEVNYDSDVGVDELREEQAYWNANDGELIFILEDRDNEVTVMDQDANIEIWEKEGMIFQDEYVGSELVPVSNDSIEVDFDE